MLSVREYVNGLEPRAHRAATGGADLASLRARSARSNGERSGSTGCAARRRVRVEQDLSHVPAETTGEGLMRVLVAATEQ
jgi:hypothetical protein